MSRRGYAETSSRCDIDIAPSMVVIKTENQQNSLYLYSTALKHKTLIFPITKIFKAETKSNSKYLKFLNLYDDQKRTNNFD